jgi:hypothetical protein
MWYTASILVTCAGYGDMVPYGVYEVTWTILTVFIGRITIGFMLVECESYLESICAHV